MKYKQTNKSSVKQGIKWSILIILTVVLVVLIKSSPVNTKAAQKNIVPFIGTKEGKRDLSTPLSRLAGYWECISGGPNVYYTVDSRQLFGSCEIDQTKDTVLPVKFKVLYNDSSGENLQIKEFIPLIDHKQIPVETDIRISKDGQSMTKEWNFNDGDSQLLLYRYSGRYRDQLLLLPDDITLTE